MNAEKISLNQGFRMFVWIVSWERYSSKEGACGACGVTPKYPATVSLNM